MPLSTLNRMSVPQSDQIGNQALLMPKLQYRFRVNFTGFGDDGTQVRDITRQVVEVTRPNLTFENIAMDVYNSKVNIAGKHTWDTVSLTLRDDITNSVQSAVGKQLQRQFDFWEQASATAASSYKFETMLEILDGGNGAKGPVVLDKYHLVGCYLEGANYNTLNYATNDAVTVTLTIRYDNAIQYGGDSDVRVGVGTAEETVDPNGTLATGARRPLPAPR